MKKVIIIIITLLVCISGCSTITNESDYMTSIKEYCDQKGFVFRDNSKALSNKEAQILFPNVNIDISIDITKHTYRISVEKINSDFSESDINAIVFLTNVVSRKDLSIEDIIDFIQNDKYSVFNPSENQSEVCIHIRNFDFWQEYTAEYRVYNYGTRWLYLIGKTN